MGDYSQIISYNPHENYYLDNNGFTVITNYGAEIGTLKTNGTIENPWWYYRKSITNTDFYD